MRMNLSKIGHDFVIYDGVNMADHFIVRTFDMPLLPTIDADTIVIDGKPGVWFANRKIGTRDIIIGLGILNETKDREDILANWFRLTSKVAKNKVAKLELGNGFYVWAMLIGDSMITTQGKWSIVELTFRCFDPYIYGEQHIVDLKTGNNVVAIHGGNAAFPTFAISGATTTTITNVDSGDKFRVENIPAGQTLTVDMEHQSCMSAGVYRPIDLTISDFWSIEPGTATINISSGSGVMIYNEVYL